VSKLDSAKESLNTLRVLLSIFVAIAVTLSGALVSNARNNIVDIYFYLGSLLIFLFTVAIIVILKKIKLITKDVKEL